MSLETFLVSMTYPARATALVLIIFSPIILPIMFLSREFPNFKNIFFNTNRLLLKVVKGTY